MRILMISGEYPPMQGGVGDYTREMARAFVAQGHQVWVLVAAALSAAHPDDHDGPWQVLPRISGWDRRSWREVISAAVRVQPDVIDIQYQAAAYDLRSAAINFLPWRLSWLADAPPVIVTFHDLKPPYLFPKAGPMRDWAVRQMARHSTAVVVTNAEDLSRAAGWPFVRTGVSPSVHLVPIGSNIPLSPPPSFNRDVWRGRFGYDADTFVWAYFGFLNESKGGETLIRALAVSPANHRLLMIGDRVGSSDPTNREYARRVQALIDRHGLGDRVTWTGYLPKEEVSAALLSADIVVLPYRDGISFRRGSLHAALLHGRPVVSTSPKIPLPELRDGTNVLLVQPGDPGAVSSAAVRLEEGPELRQRIERGAKALAAQFTWDQIAQRTVQEVMRPAIEKCR
jgi:glycosyltransferase involved in cell wall biosynthesis